MVTLFTWDDSFLTHLPSVDEQHQRLVNLINDLGRLAMSAEVIEPRMFATMRDAVLDYAVTHFSHEEAQMNESGLDPRHVNRHMGEHRAFLNEALSLVEIGDNIPHDRADALVEYLVRWLAYHILGVDQSMARQLRAIDGGLSPEQAFEQDVGYVTSGSDPLVTAISRLYHVVAERNRELQTLNRELDQRMQQRSIELERANRELQLLAVQDDLTGLPNRRFALLSLKQLWVENQRYGGSLSLLMLDADNFKQVNDRFGHAQGDAVLQALATRLRNVVRKSDIVCRLGGDEFLVICPRTTRTGATEVARKVLAGVQPFCTADGVECWDGAVSIGIAEADDVMTQPEDLLHASDDALYAAKRQGGPSMAGHSVK